jgi:hypothetical protein
MTSFDVPDFSNQSLVIEQSVPIQPFGWTTFVQGGTTTSQTFTVPANSPPLTGLMMMVAGSIFDGVTLEIIGVDSNFQYFNNAVNVNTIQVFDFMSLVDNQFTVTASTASGATSDVTIWFVGLSRSNTTYPVVGFDVGRQGATNGAYTEVATAGTTNIFTVSNSKTNRLWTANLLVVGTTNPTECNILVDTFNTTQVPILSVGVNAGEQSFSTVSFPYGLQLFPGAAVNLQNTQGAAGVVASITYN